MPPALSLTKNFLTLFIIDKLFVFCYQKHMGALMLILKCLITILLLVLCCKTEPLNIQHPSNPKPTFYLSTWDTHVINRNNTFHYMASKLTKPEHGYFTMNTLPPPQDFDLINKNNIHLTVWKSFRIPSPEKKKKSYLWQIESPIAIQVPPPQNYVASFQKIFTYAKSAADEKKVIYVPIPYNFEKIIRNYSLQHKKTLVTIVNTYHTGNLYDLRIKSVQWFLENHPNDILIYGSGWQSLKEKLSPNGQNAFDSQYKGYTDDKIETISTSKFSLAYENTSFPDYVSEKIFDVMAAGSVPIYAGAPNITDYFPKACFISYNDFKSHEELYQFLTTMDDNTYQKYLNCIQKFMENPEKNPNHYKNVANKVLKHIKKDRFSFF